MPMIPDCTRLLLIAVALVLAGCGSSKIRGDGPGRAHIPELPDDAVPRPEPRSRYGNGRDNGNGPGYEVFGKWYSVMDSSAGYQERGVASWYGKKFHGNLTSNREVYDMYEMTAAHKSLPLPTYVRVRNLRNDKSIVVRVNDRGPFIDNRIIDLSYAAALKLDMVRDGTSLVEVTAINFEEAAVDRPTSVEKPPRRVLQSTPAIAPDAAATEPPAVSENRVFVQVGAFGDRRNAERRKAALADFGIDNVAVHADDTAATPLFRVRIGPLAGAEQYDQIVVELGKLGIKDPYLIVE